MQLYSTNDKTRIVDLKEAVLNAFPPDRGLYMPTQIPLLSKTFIDNLSQYTFQEIGFIVAQNILGNSVPEKELYELIRKAINFPAPLVHIQNNISALELFHGPTMAFKDFGARFMAELMGFYLKDENRNTTILVATSGDTGGAVAAGFFNVPGINVIILYPSGGVSQLQEKQLTTWGHNITAIEVKGTFDDCQFLVKEAFVDSDLKEKFSFSSANSINIARLIPQSFYYFEAFKQLSKPITKTAYVVPSGNFGNLTAGLLAKKMGLPINHFAAATNINNTVPKYLNTGEYKIRPSEPTISNAMDVGNPSNFPRMLALYSEGSTWNMLRKDISGFSYTDQQTVDAMHHLKDLGYAADPHGAIGYLASEELSQKGDWSHIVFLETAHPGKFTDSVVKQIPEKLKSFMIKEKEAIPCNSGYQDFKEILFNLP